MRIPVLDFVKSVRVVLGRSRKKYETESLKEYERLQNTTEQIDSGKNQEVDQGKQSRRESEKIRVDNNKLE